MAITFDDEDITPTSTITFDDEIADQPKATSSITFDDEVEKKSTITFDDEEEEPSAGDIVKGVGVEVGAGVGGSVIGGIIGGTLGSVIPGAGTAAGATRQRRQAGGFAILHSRPGPRPCLRQRRPRAQPQALPR